MCVQCKDRFIASLSAIESGCDTSDPYRHRDQCITSSWRFKCEQGRDTSVPTIAESSLPQEDFVVRCWESLPSGTEIPLIDGGTCQLLFRGRAGSSAGPDVRDAVLLFPNGAHRTGDIEFHVRASDWVAHKHATDPRYNNVILHVVLLCDDLNPMRRQDGYALPTCSLYDLPIAFGPLDKKDIHTEEWPCHIVMKSLSAGEQEKLLHRAGLLRFEQKTHAFIEALHKEEERADLYSNCLLIALAEALGYGRDRAFFRAAGQRLLGQDIPVPEPLGRSPAPSPLDAKRLKVLHTLLAEEHNVWHHLHDILIQDEGTVLHTLQGYFRSMGLGVARADILICNVVLPFAAAVALLEHDTPLEERAQKLYETHPGLPSNVITRMMCKQLLLSREPRSSCQQQGLHYIYQQTCRAKHCAACMMGRNIV